MPLIASGAITCLRLEGNSNLGCTTSRAKGEGLLHLLALSSPSLTSLELSGVTQHFSPNPWLPFLSTGIKRLSLTGSGSLQDWAHMLPRLPGLESLEVTPTPGDIEEQVIEVPGMLPDILRSLSTVRRLHLPDVTISWEEGTGSVLRALVQMPSLEDVQVRVRGQRLQAGVWVDSTCKDYCRMTKLS
jgi:hypothetical protein